MLRHEIDDVIEAAGTLLVLLYPEEGNRDRRNVLGFDKSGNKLWESKIPENSEKHMFGELHKEGDDVIGWSWNHNEYKIDPTTGELENLGYGGK